MNEEKRIYVVVAETVETALGTVTQPIGRIAAQCAHVVSKMHLKHLSPKIMKRIWEKGITTIILSVPGSAELEELRKNNFGWHTFTDHNKEAYGSGAGVNTAICTVPIKHSSLKGKLDHLSLWNPEAKWATEAATV